MTLSFFDYHLLESAVTLTFVLVAISAILLTIYFFILQRIVKKRKSLDVVDEKSNVGRYFVRVEPEDGANNKQHLSDKK